MGMLGASRADADGTWTGEMRAKTSQPPAGAKTRACPWRQVKEAAKRTTSWGLGRLGRVQERARWPAQEKEESRRKASSVRFRDPAIKTGSFYSENPPRRVGLGSTPTARAHPPADARGRTCLPADALQRGGPLLGDRPRRVVVVVVAA